MASLKINGVTVVVPEGAIAYKYADPIEDARWVYDESELEEIRRADPSLIEVPECIEQPEQTSANLKTFHWRTDAASGEVQAETPQQVFNQLVWDREWADIDTAREQREIADGAFLLISHEDGTEALTRGVVP